MHPFTYACPLRWADVDAYGHVNNAQFLRYMEDARARMFREVMPRDEDARRTNAFVVRRSVVDYRAPLQYRYDPVDVRVWVTKATAAQFELSYEIRDTDQVFAEATTSMAAFNLITGSPRRLSDRERAFLDLHTLR